jgi:hypothetical protein
MPLRGTVPVGHIAPHAESGQETSFLTSRVPCHRRSAGATVLAVADLYARQRYGGVVPPPEDLMVARSAPPLALALADGTQAGVVAKTA